MGLNDDIILSYLGMDNNPIWYIQFGVSPRIHFMGVLALRSNDLVIYGAHVARMQSSCCSPT